jgi:hypothetical protein
VANKRTRKAKDLVAKIARINNIDSADIVFLLEQRPLNTDQNNLNKYSNQKEERENIFSVLKNKTFLKNISYNVLYMVSFNIY